jgi:hypothetical protein
MFRSLLLCFLAVFACVLSAPSRHLGAVSDLKKQVFRAEFHTAIQRLGDQSSHLLKAQSKKKTPGKTPAF